jgi:5-formyltetrahydrofolate cyclo-ligase
VSSADVPSHRLKRAKRALRRSVIERRDRMPAAERRDLSRRIADRLLALAEVKNAGTVMAFWSFGSEVDTAPLIERLHAAGARVVLPRVEGDEIVAVAFAPGDPATRTPFGAFEPSGTDVVDPWDVDVVVTPGVAFDRRGRRVGYGGGFYDRFLPRTRPGAPPIAVAFALQVVDEVPGGRADRPVDVVVTEDEVIRCRPR